jgi:NADH-quinone oxidoreductase subunit J
MHQNFAQAQNINAQVIGKALFSEWVLPFEIVSTLLLAAMLGAIVIARKEKNL